MRGHALQPKGSKRDPGSSMTRIEETETAPAKEESRDGHTSDDYEALLSHFESLKARQPSPTSSSSSYASASSSVRSRSSWSTDPNEFPFSFRPLEPDIKETPWSVEPGITSPRSPLVWCTAPSHRYFCAVAKWTSEKKIFRKLGEGVDFPQFTCVCVF